MARKLIKSNCEVVNTLGLLSGVLTKITSGEYDYEQAQEEVQKIYNSWLKSKSGNDFGELLIKSGLSSYNFAYKELIPKLPYLQIEALDADNEDLFKYRDTAKNKIEAKFSHDVFKYLFINRDRSHIGNPYVTSKNEFNIGVAKFKNELCKFIAKSLGLEDKNFFNSSGAIIENGDYNYIDLINKPEVSKFLSVYLNKVLSDPIRYKEQFNIVYSLYAINNFDTLFQRELDGLINIDQEVFGTLDNNNYIQETDNNSTEYWANDTHEDKNIKNYTSNLAKFIIRQIPRIVKNGSILQHLEGEYLNPNDLYVLSHIIKQAEFEYNILYPDSKVILAQDLVNGVKTLFEHKEELPAFKQAKLDVIYSIEAFLWNGDSKNYSISELFQKNFKYDNNILDIESILMFEAYQSVAPTYTEFTEDLLQEDTNYGGLYQGGSQLKWNLTEFIFSQVVRKRKSITSSYFNKGNPKEQDIDSKIIKTLVDEGLYIDRDIYRNFIEQNIDILNYLAEKIAVILHSPTNIRAKSIRESIKENDQISLYSKIEDYVVSILDPKSYQNYTEFKKLPFNKELFRKFKQDYIRLISDNAVTQWDSNSGSTIPTYRLNSAITHLSWFLSQYKDTNPAESQNFLVDNPLILSKYNSKDIIKGDYNSYYKGQVSYFLGYGEGDQYIDFNEMSPEDQLHIKLLGNLQSLINGLFYTQPVCYSDKSSIGNITVNLNAALVNKKNGVNYSLSEILDLFDPESSIQEIRKLDYKYRKNSVLYLVNNILGKWNQILSDEGLKPIENLEYNRTDLRPTIYEEIRSKFIYLDQILKSKSKQELQNYIRKAQDLGIELIDEQDYVLVQGQLGINQSILFDLDNVKNYKTFNQTQDQALDRFFNSEEYQNLIQSIQDKLSQSKKDSPYYKLLMDNPNFPKYFKRTYDSKQKKYKVESIIENNKVLFNEFIRLHSALSNLVSYSIRDLISKQYYLDPAKKILPHPQLEKAKRIDAMAKRMVLYPATIQAYQQGKLNGVSQEVKVAVIKDPSEKTWNLNGNEHNQDIFDGCGFLSPYYSMMEDNSLPGHGIHGTKKTLGVSTRGTNSTLFKWAGFPITNEKMRNSLGCKYSLLDLYRKMHDLKWQDPNIDLTKDYMFNPITPSKLIKAPLYYSDGFNFYQIKSLEYLGENGYIIHQDQVSFTGKLLSQEVNKEVIIDSIYTLWEALGGVNSLQLENGILENSENSIMATMQYIINIGTIRNRNSRRLDQQSVYQPLRNQFISICANKSAIKRGSANLNEAKDAWETDKPLTTFTINTSCFGVQLDANHHSDLADIREMSQTISTLACNGYTMDLAEEVYNSIGTLVDLSLSKINKYISLQEKQGLKASIGEISQRLVKRLSQEAKISSVDAFIDMFTEDLNTFILPISDRRFYKLFIKDIIESLNKSSIRRRYSGLGGILNPASNIMQLYEFNGKQYLYSTLLREARKNLSKDLQAKQALQERWNSINSDKNQDIIRYYQLYTLFPKLSSQDIIDRLDKPISIPIEESKIKILDTIKYTIDSKEEIITLDTPNAFIDLKKIIDQNTDPITGEKNIQLELVITTPHDLRPQNISWITTVNETNKVAHSVYNTIGARLSQAVGKVQKDLDNIDSIIADLAEDGQNIEKSCKL